MDCFGDPKITGKVGTDIEDNKCSWLVVQALAKANAEQRALLEVSIYACVIYGCKLLDMANDFDISLCILFTLYYYSTAV